MRRFNVVAILVVLFTATPRVSLSLTIADACAIAKHQEVARYVACRSKAEAQRVKTGDAAVYANAVARCATNLAARWAAAEQRAADLGGACPVTGDAGAMLAALDGRAMRASAALAGVWSPATCGGDRTLCEDDLAGCTGGAPLGRVRHTGQAVCWNATGTAIPCTSTSLDAEQRTGLVRRYADNGDGTVTDQRTGLTWEKLSADGSEHDKDADYGWNEDPGFEPFVSTKLADLNAGGGFAGYTDWRVPNQRELLSLVDYGRHDPAVPLEFDSGCAPGCTVLTCSCTGTEHPTSSSTSAVPFPSYTKQVRFSSGFAGTVYKYHRVYIRAVRGGA